MSISTYPTGPSHLRRSHIAALRASHGWSPSRTNFVGNPIGSPPTAWFHLSQYSGLANVSLTAPANRICCSALAPYSEILRRQATSISAVSKLTSTTDASNGAEYMTALAGPDIQVYNSTFLSNANQVFDILFGDGWRSEFSRSMRFTEHRDLSRGRRVSTGCLCNWLDNRAMTEHCIFRHRIGQHFPAPNQVSQE